MKLHLPTKIPTLLGILMILGFIVLASISFDMLFGQQTNASISVEPANVLVTNISDTSLTITWMTSDTASGAIVLNGKDRRSQTIFDDRDANGKLQAYTTHSITSRELSPDTDYSVKILSNGKPYLNRGSDYIIRTAPRLASGGNGLDPAFGNVFTPGNNPATGAIVYLTMPNSQTLSTLVSESGSWLIPLNLIRNTDLRSVVAPSERNDLTIRVRHPLDDAEALTDTLNDSPVPDMIIGKRYDFRKQQAKATLSAPKSLANLTNPTPPPSQSSVLGVIVTPDPKKFYAVTITQPTNGATLVSDTPLFAGTGVPGKAVSITWGVKNPQAALTTVSPDGLWRFSPTTAVSSGEQSVTITSVDTKGKTVALTHLFEVLKSGTQVLGVATPSGSLAPTPTRTPTPTRIPSINTTPTPTTAVPTITPPVSGSVLPSYLLILVSALLLTSGVVLYIK